jgi:RpiR family carbohydrate utilization transcriptional regulator
MSEGDKVKQAQDLGDLLPRVEAMIPRLTKSDAKLARLLIRTPQVFVGASVRAIAGDLGISEATVVRFCRTVGCDGFRDLKIQLARELAQRQAVRDSMGQGMPNPAAPRPSIESVGSQVYAAASRALTTAHETLDVDILKRAARAIARARRVIIYGLGGSSAILAAEMHNRLFRFGVGAQSYTDSYAQRMAAATLTSNDVAVFVSSTGRPRALQDSLELATYYGATSIAITDPESVLGRDATICLPVRLSQSGVDELQPNPMRYAQMFTIDVLAFYVALEMGEQAHACLNQTRASVASLHGIAPQQPIGD